MPSLGDVHIAADPGDDNPTLEPTLCGLDNTREPVKFAYENGNTHATCEACITAEAKL